ncbi:transglutaminase-like domain-containing protein [Novipirellula herctigrandis]
MTVLTTFGAAAVAMTIGSNRTRAMSLVVSGFLTLFAVTISDNRYAVVLAIAWMAVCVWHLVANHWERLELCAVQQVRRGAAVRPASVVVAIVICMMSGLIVRDRFGETKRFTSGFMPTSGGSKWSDPAARSGVGTGDAAIAAKDHAESFGAVESELFLESTESTLFDMFSDSIGEPKKNKWERRQGLTPEKLIKTHEQTAKSEKGGSSFSTERMPPKKHLHLNDSVENAVVQWAGPTGIRLAMNRYDTFDGVDWSNSSTQRNEKLARREIGGAAWFFDPATLVAGREPSASRTDVNLLKVLRLDSTRLPTPMMTSGLHIKDVDRQDFVGIEDDGSYFMPGRDQVPALTVVNVASANVMEDELWNKLPFHRPASEKVKHGQPKLLASVATDWTAQCDHTYEKLQAIVSRLRTEFTFDRSVQTVSSDPIAEFLETRRGGDHLFATTAAMMVRELGLKTRLVTGFYVRPSAADIADGHTNVLPEDVHVWVEVRLDDGRWFEIEPTPEYRQPNYRPSTWLVAKRYATNYWLHAIGLLVLGGVLLRTRLLWIELGLSVLYPVGALLWPRRRMRLAMKVLQTRALLAGCPRVAGCPQRDWLLSLTAGNENVREAARRFCDVADRAAFAGREEAFYKNKFEKELLMHLKIKTLRRIQEEVLV